MGVAGEWNALVSLRRPVLTVIIDIPSYCPPLSRPFYRLATVKNRRVNVVVSKKHEMSAQAGTLAERRARFATLFGDKDTDVSLRFSTAYVRLDVREGIGKRGKLRLAEWLLQWQGGKKKS